MALNQHQKAILKSIDRLIEIGVGMNFPLPTEVSFEIKSIAYHRTKISEMELLNSMSYSEKYKVFEDSLKQE